MNYSVEYQKSALPMADFQRRYQNKEKFLAYCQECPRYDHTWSCPPLNFDADAYLHQFAWVNVICAKINLSPQIIHAADTPEKMKSMGWEILLSVKLDLEEKLRRLEKEIPASISLSSGGCNLCEKCNRSSGLPCRHSDKMRYSLDAFGFDLSAITRDLFAIDILWCKDHLPAYFTLIHGLLTKEQLAPEVFEEPARTV
ncbi:MAG: DUF2284 domain-containing protein [Selenomonas sp.]|uniref:DUF2284 domain-containing protein n=1 Tax=Selenomonas sp. TaxID=2053611 RepID=UPI0025FE66B9|nr:DUF2284 domain-containing protein [Selenomonas sp.]MCR5758726.1 DUF2284 domain-containing protein [Selenomonas sp.]